MFFLLTSSALVLWVLDCACYSKQRTKRTYLQASSDKIQSYEKLAFKTTSICPEHKLIIYFPPKPNKDLAFSRKSSYDTTSIAHIIKRIQISQAEKILLVKSRIPVFGIRNPIYDWNQESKFHWQNLESEIHGVESRIQDFLGFPSLSLRSANYYTVRAWTQFVNWDFSTTQPVL